MNVVRSAALMVVIGGLVALSGCAPSSEAASPVTPSPTPSAEAPASQEPVAAPSPEPLDPADMSTWVAGSAGIGAVERGASWGAVEAQLAGMTVETLCPSAVSFTADASPTIYVGLEADGDTIRQVWAAGDAADTASPSTIAGIALGATLAEVQAAYPGIAETVIPYPADTNAYAVADDDGSWLVFSLRDGVVTQIGASALQFPPKELCG
ncbi:hypothetical protein JOE59_002574 [Agromyces cerinus]|uniref:hypothetical protein n=1 Tax=Agromyces cerinus TaxID=33878 RepID=UPI001957680A|nr:hypothetical protein [Agromyces cerinus]MBM7831869.1 hypothetical protein [Agromyces cerinus]